MPDGLGGDPTDMTDDELDAHAMAYVYGEADFSGLPVVQVGPYPSPEDHPDNDPLRPVLSIQSDADFKADLAYLYDLVDRIATRSRDEAA